MADKQPSICNTSIQNTFLIHWVEFTCEKSIDPQTIINRILNMHEEKFKTIGKYIHGYKSCMSTADKSIKILLENANFEKGPRVLISGSGCDKLGNKIFEILKSAELFLCKFNRIDIAVDDFTKTLSIQQIGTYFENGFYRCKASGHTISGFDKSKGTSYILGASNKRLIIYDKSIESNGPFDHWIRCEFQIRNKGVNEIVKEINANKNVGLVFSNQIMSFLKFVEPQNDKNKSRWPISEWWNNFLLSANGYNYTKTPKQIKNDEKLIIWFATICCRAFYETYEKYGFLFLIALLNEGRTKSNLHKYNK